jgi:lysophospholipase L1-like esterase
MASHTNATTSVHGIANTAGLETTTGAQAKVDTHAANKNLHGAERSIIPAVKRYRAEAARARAGGSTTYTVWLGDSLTEAFNPSKRGYIWPLILGRRLNGWKQTRVEYIPTSANTFCLVSPASAWPGSQIPWNYVNASGDVSYGMDLHAVNITAGGYAELNYYGDIVQPIYVRTTAAPAGGCPVTIDGVSVGTLSANGSLLPAQAASFGTIGDYGAHTIRITVPSGTLTLEGMVVYDGIAWGFGLPFGGIGSMAAGHAGFSTTHFSDVVATYWATSLSARTPSLVGIALGANDFGAARTATQYRDSLVTIMNRIDAAVDAIGGTRPGYLLVEMVGLPDDYITAAWEACDTVDTDRCAVLDLGARLNTTNWGVLDNGGHPGDSGQIWIADAIADAIDDSATGVPNTPPEGVVVEAATSTVIRSSWTESLTAVPDSVVPIVYDASPTGATVGERRHRIWLDAGTYQGRIMLARGNDRGQCQVLVGHTSLGTADCYQASADVTVFTLGSNVTIDYPGWYPVTIRKLATKNASSSEYAIRFYRLHLRKT